MAILIDSVLPGSLAASKGVKRGEKLLRVNGLEVRDFLDLEFYSSDYHFTLELQDSNGTIRTLDICRDDNRPLGIEPQPYYVRSCANACIFCFIDQMPPMMRSSLYEKDDDYIFSFVFGNYITLTNLQESDLQRIIKQRITPLYISLHTTNNELRQKMMRSAKPVNVQSVLTRLSKAGISFHVQIVCVPGYNDGEELNKTLSELLGSKWNCLSIGIVPVGLTKFRSGLCALRSFEADSAMQLLNQVEDIRQRLDSQIIYPADEFYVLAGQEIPEDEFYQDYPQLENGIGMLRLSYQNFKHKKRALLKELRRRKADNLWVCSRSAKGLMFRIADELNQRLDDQKVRVQVINNDYFGPQISVSGLLTYSDLKAQLEPLPGEIIVLPSVIFNHNGETLDGASQLTLKQTWDHPILLINQYFEDWDYL